MKNKARHIFPKIHYLFLSSLVMSITSSILIQFEPNQPVTILFITFEKFISIPLFFTLRSFPFALIVWLLSYIFSSIIKDLIKKKNILLDIYLSSFISSIILLLLPKFIINPFLDTNYRLFINPYCSLVPFIGAITMTFLENMEFIKKK